MKEPFNSLIMIFAAIFYLGTIWCLEHQYNKIIEQAVERGCAEWIVNNDGNTTWQWKEAK